MQEAEDMYRESLAIRRKAFEADGDHSNVAASLTNLGNLLQEKGDLQGAEERLREALEMQRKAYGGEHPEVTEAPGAQRRVLDCSSFVAIGTAS